MPTIDKIHQPVCPPAQQQSSAVRRSELWPGLDDSAREPLGDAIASSASLEARQELLGPQGEGHSLTRTAPFPLAGLTSGDAALLEAEANLKRAQADESSVPLTSAKLRAEADALDGLAGRLRGDQMGCRLLGLRAGRGGEVSFQPVNSMTAVLREVAEVVHAAPGLLDAEATQDRLNLTRDAGVLTQAVHAAESVGAGNAIEQMLIHQMTLGHKVVMGLMTAAGRSIVPGGSALTESCRAATSAARLLDSYTRGALALDRLRNGGRQHVTVQHVNVADGGQAVVAGSVTPRGGGVQS